MTVGMGSLLFSVITIRIAVAKQRHPFPQAILVLEGRTERIDFAAQFARSYPHLPIWVSGNPDGLRLNQSIFRQAGVQASLVHYDFCAVDTVTNFTCNVPTLKAQNIHHIFVITSDYHMARSQAIAAIVLGSQGIAITPIMVVSDGQQSETALRILRDSLRSLLWLFTGVTGASLHRFF